MMRFQQYPYLVPSVLGILGIILLVRIVADDYILLPEDTDVVILLAIVSVGMIIAIHVLVRISLTYLRYITMRRVRNETLSEHRRFLQRLDHELKNPLTAIRTGLKTLTITSLDAQQHLLVATMETEVVRLSRLVTDLRKITDLETQALSLQPTNIKSLLNTIFENEKTRFEAEQRKFDFSLSFSRTIWIVDEDLLTVVIYNLLDNAFKYTNPADTVTVAVNGHHELRIEIQDTGIGISNDDIPQIWEELYRSKQVTHISGHGIGLALVKAIIERHHGTIDIESEENIGTTIYIQIPYLT